MDLEVHRLSKLFSGEKENQRHEALLEREPVPAQQGYSQCSQSSHLQKTVPDGNGCTQAQ